jgi:hypothetical protein
VAVFEITVQGSEVYWRLGLEGTKCATKKIEHATSTQAKSTMSEMIDKRLAEGFKHQRSLM